MNTVRKLAGVSAAAVWLLVVAPPTDAHHSAAFFDTDSAVIVSGTVVRFERTSPHSYLYVRQQTPDGPIEWAVEGPAPNLLIRRGTAEGLLEPGDSVEACGYRFKGNAEDAGGRGSHLIVAELVLMPDGEARLWSDYGNHHCRDQNRYRYRGP